MKIADVKVGDEVKVKRGYSIRPAVVKSVYDGKISVAFTDIDRDFLATNPANLQDYFGATVRPNAVSPK